MIVLAVDSGIEKTGYAIVKNARPNPKIIDYGCIYTKKLDTNSSRIAQLANAFGKIIDKYKPDTVVIEKLFFNANKKTVISVAQAQGATMYVAALRNCRVEFLTPLQIKETLTGYGRADKKQIEKMLTLLLGVDTVSKTDDVNDAIACALAYCTLYNFNSKIEAL